MQCVPMLSNVDSDAVCVPMLPSVNSDAVCPNVVKCGQ